MDMPEGGEKVEDAVAAEACSLRCSSSRRTQAKLDQAGCSSN